MPILAELSETVWLAIIAGVMLTVKQVLEWVGLVIKDIMERRRSDEIKLATAIEAAKVKEALEASNRKQEAANKQQTAHLQSQDMAIDVIRKENNGAKEELVREVRSAAFAAGAKSETDKQPIGHDFSIEPGKTSVVIEGTITPKDHP